MKASIKVNEYGGVTCDETCWFSKECANHRTAGDFRMEDGFTPELFEENGVFYCHTKTRKAGDERYGTFPDNYNLLDRGCLSFKDGEFVACQ